MPRYSPTTSHSTRTPTLGNAAQLAARIGAERRRAVRRRRPRLRARRHLDRGARRRGCGTRSTGSRSSSPRARPDRAPRRLDRSRRLRPDPGRARGLRRAPHGRARGAEPRDARRSSASTSSPPAITRPSASASRRSPTTLPTRSRSTGATSRSTIPSSYESEKTARCRLRTSGAGSILNPSWCISGGGPVDPRQPQPSVESARPCSLRRRAFFMLAQRRRRMANHLTPEELSRRARHRPRCDHQALHRGGRPDLPGQDRQASLPGAAPGSRPARRPARA